MAKNAQQLITQKFGNQKQVEEMLLAAKSANFVKSLQQATKMSEADQIKTSQQNELKPPTENEVAQAVTNSLQREVPVSWVGNLLGGHSAKLSSINVVKIGNYNRQKNYWPMMVKVVGHCQLNDMFNKDKKIEFDKIGDFKFYRDDYGQLRAVLGGGMFQ